MRHFRFPHFLRPEPRTLNPLLLLALFATPAHAGTVRTIDGKTYEGDLRLDKNQILITPKRTAVVRIDLTNVLSADFKSPAKPAVPAAPPPPQKLDAAWKTADVGRVGVPGSVQLAGGVWSLKGAGNNIAAQADTFYFVYQELKTGDAQIIARLDDLQRGANGAKVGLMLRESLDRSAPNVLLCVIPQEGFNLSWRTEPGGPTSRAALSEEPLPVWLRLVRSAGTVTAFKAAEGGKWIQVGKPVEWAASAKSILAGLAVCSHDVNNPCAATFQGVKVSTGPIREDPPAAVAALPGAAPPANPNNVRGRAVLLRDGSVLLHATVQSADTNFVRLTRNDGKAITLPTSDVARLVLAPATPQQLAKLPAAATPGVLLARGDFMEGELESLSNGRVKMNSVLFGPSNLAVGSEAVIVILRDAAPAGADAAWVVRTTDGVLYMAKSLRVEGSQLLIEDQSGATAKIGGGNISEIKSGSGRIDALADLRPSVEGSAVTPSSPVTLDGQSLEKPVPCLAGSSLTYDLAAKYRLFSCRCGVPDGVLPTVAARFVIVADGKELYRSPPLTSFDEALAASVDIAGAKTLTLRTEGAAGVNLPVPGVWADAVLVK